MTMRATGEHGRPAPWLIEPPLYSIGQNDDESDGLGLRGRFDRLGLLVSKGKESRN